MAVSTAKAVWSVCLFVGHRQQMSRNMRSASSAPCASLSRAYDQTANGDRSAASQPHWAERIRRRPRHHSRSRRAGKPSHAYFLAMASPRGGGVAVAVAGDIVVAKALQIRTAPDTQAIKTGKGVEGNGALRPCALHKSWGAHVSDGSRLCKNVRNSRAGRNTFSIAFS
jgi:hypothetical protein